MSTDIIDADMIKNWYIGVRKEYVDVDAKFQALRKRREDLTVQLGSLEPLLAQAGINVNDLKQSIKSSKERESEKGELKTLPEAISEILRNSTVPMHYNDILAALKEKGHVVLGRDPRNTVLAYISRHKKRFTKAPEAGRGHYKLRD